MSLLCRIAVVVGLLMLGGALGLALGSGLYAADLPLVPHSRISTPRTNQSDVRAGPWNAA